MKKRDIWFMAYPLNEIFKNFLSVVTGILLMLFLLFLTGPIFYSFSYSFMDFSEGANPAQKKNDRIIELLFYSWLVIPSFTGALVTTLISTRRDVLHVLLCAIIIIAISVITGFNELYQDLFRYGFIKAVLTVLLFCLIGYSAGKKIKQIYGIKNGSSPPGTP